MSAKKAAQRQLTHARPVKLTPAIEAKLEEAAGTTGLKTSDLLRMSVDRGLDVLLAQLSSEPKPTHSAA